MDARQFDRLVVILTQCGSRRQVVRGIVATAAAALAGHGAAATRAQGDSACATFCQHLPPGRQRGQCVSACAQGGGLYAACGGDPSRLCLAPDGTAICCASGQPCQNGVCGCGSGSAFCAATGACVSTYCNYREVFDPTACQCRCDDPYATTPAGGCGVPCQTDADCGSFGHCSQTTEGQGFCRCGTLVHCTNCTSSVDCSNGCFAINTVCDAGDHGRTVVC